MRLHFLGANRQVTGSRYCLEVGPRKILVDCGMFQERAYLDRNWETSPIPVEQFDAMVLTHAHLDHCGLIPRLYDAGFRGDIVCTRPTVDLARIIMEDSAEIQEEDAEYKRKRHAKEGRTDTRPPQPLYTLASAQESLQLFQGQPYREEIVLFDDVRVVFHDAGHILGSAMVEFHVGEGNNQQCVFFSGDIGQPAKPFLHDPHLIERADYLVMESTYGDRFHEKGGEIVDELALVINKTVSRGGNVIIPTFAVERAQELMYYLSILVHEDRIPQMQVFLDSPMAVDVTDLFTQHRDCFDEETWGRILAQQPPLKFPGLQLVRSVAESKAINEVKKPCVIMASSGMCTAGRIKHHLKRNLDGAENTVLFVGYQAHGTLGRLIRDGKPEVRIHGRQYKNRAEVAEIDGFSGHADRAGLLNWLAQLEQPPKQIFLTHGEEDAAASLAAAIADRYQYSALVPEYQAVVELE